MSIETCTACNGQPDTDYDVEGKDTNVGYVCGDCLTNEEENEDE